MPVYAAGVCRRFKTGGINRSDLNPEPQTHAYGNELLDQGGVYVKELQDFKAARKTAGAHNAVAGTKRKRKSEDKLKVKNPW